MSKVKAVTFEDEEALQSIEELTEDKAVISEPSEEEIESLFTNVSIQVDEVPKTRTDMVEVIPLRDDHFSFGGTWYHLTKGKRQPVPSAVRDFLLRNKQNPRIKDIY